MYNPHNIIENIISFERRFYEINPSGKFLESLVEFCYSFKPLLPPHYSVAISDTEKFITSLIGQTLKLPVIEKQKIEGYWKISQVIVNNEAVTQSSNAFGFDFIQTTVPLHDIEGNVIGSFSLFSKANLDKISEKDADYRDELVRAICIGMETVVICRYLAEKMNHLLSVNHILFTEYNSNEDCFFSISEFKFDKTKLIFENFDREKLRHGRSIYSDILNSAQSYISRTVEVPDVRNAPFKTDNYQTFIVTPIISKDQIIGTMNLGFINKAAIDKKSIELIEELAGYLSICMGRDLIVKSLDQNVKKVFLAEQELKVFQDKISLRDLTTEFMSDTRDQLFQIIKNVYVLCESESYRSSKSLLHIVDYLQKMTTTISHLWRNTANFDNSNILSVDIKSLIEEALLETEEKIIFQNFSNKSISFTNLITSCGVVELNRNEFNLILSDTLLLLLNKSQSESKIYLGSRVTEGRTFISIKNFNEKLPARQQPKRTEGLDKKSELGFRLIKMLFDMNDIEFHFDSPSDFDYSCEIIFKLEAPVQQTQPEGELHKDAKVENESFNILIVDDDDSLRELMIDILESRNFKVACYGDALSAIAAFKQRKFDLLITDLSLPKISGIELAAKIKAINPAVPVIMVTGWSSGIEQIKEENPQVDHILSKPFNLNDLLSVVEGSLQTLNPI